MIWLGFTVWSSALGLLCLAVGYGCGYLRGLTAAVRRNRQQYPEFMSGLEVEMRKRG